MRVSISFRAIHVFLLDNYYSLKQNISFILLLSIIITISNYVLLFFFRSYPQNQSLIFIRTYFLGVNPLWVFIGSLSLIINFQAAQWLEIFTYEGQYERVKRQEIEQAMQFLIEPENKSKIDPKQVQDLKEKEETLSQTRKRYVKDKEQVFSKIKEYYQL